MPSITQDVLFNLGVTGADGTISKVGGVALKFGAVAAAASLAGNAIAGAVKSADDFADAVKASDMDMGRFLQTTKGLITSMGAYQNANKLQAASVKITSDQMDALGKKAVQMADSLGTDATQEFEKLTDAVIRANARGLVPYGVQLESTGDKTKDQQLALEALTGTMVDYQVELGNTTEKVQALGNTLTTTRDLLLDGAWRSFVDFLPDAFDGLSSINTTMQQLNTALLESDGILAKWMFSWEGIGNTIAGVYIEAQRLMPWGWLAGKVGDALGLDTSALNTFAENQYAAEQSSRKEAQANRAVAGPKNVGGPQVVGGKRGGGGGGKKSTPSDMEFGLEEITAYEDLAIAGQIDGTWGSSEGGRGGSMSRAYAEQQAAERLAIQADFEQRSADRWFEQESAKMGSMQDFKNQELEMERAKYEQMNEMQRAQYDRDKQWNEMRKIDQANTYANGVATIGNMMGQIASMQDKNSRKGFETSKKLQLAQAAMTLPQAIMNAWNSGMQFGPASIVMAPLLTALTTGIGIAQIAQISAMKYGGGSVGVAKSSGSVSMPSGGLNSYGGGNSSGGGSTIVNNVILDGTTIHSSMIRANDGASQRGDRSFSTAA